MKLERIQIPSSTYGPNAGLRIKAERHQTLTEDAVTLDTENQQKREQQQHYGQPLKKGKDPEAESVTAEKVESAGLDITV